MSADLKECENEDGCPKLMWECAMAWQFCMTFRDILGLRLFEMEELECALQTHSPNDFTTDLFTNLLRKLHATPTTWQYSARRLIARRYDLFDFDHRSIDPAHNPLVIEDYYTLDTKTRARLLSGICSWRMEANDIRNAIRDNSALRRAIPIGCDASNRAYWHLGSDCDSGGRIFTQSWPDRDLEEHLQNLKAPSASSANNSASTSSWLPAASSIEETQALARTMGSSESEVERKIQLAIDANVLPAMIAQRRASERVKKALSKLGGVSVKNIVGSEVRSARLRSVKYYEPDSDGESRSRPRKLARLKLKSEKQRQRQSQSRSARYALREAKTAESRISMEIEREKLTQLL